MKTGLRNVISKMFIPAAVYSHYVVQGGDNGNSLCVFLNVMILDGQYQSGQNAQPHVGMAGNRGRSPVSSWMPKVD